MSEFIFSKATNDKPLFLRVLTLKKIGLLLGLLLAVVPVMADAIYAVPSSAITAAAPKSMDDVVDIAVDVRTLPSMQSSAAAKNQLSPIQINPPSMPAQAIQPVTSGVKSLPANSLPTNSLPANGATTAMNTPAIVAISPLPADNKETQAASNRPVYKYPAVHVQPLPTYAVEENDDVVASDDIDSYINNAPQFVNLSARSALLIDANTGEILYQKDIDQVRPMASITKLMTAMVTLDAHLSMHEVITLDESDFMGPKRASSHLRAGDQLNRAELLLVALMKSENPAAAALARTYPRGRDAFIQTMNDKARKLGMTTAFFGDPTGLDLRNTASARDLAKMVAAASQYGTIRSFSSTQKYDFNLGARILHANNTNAIVRGGQWEVGVSKTGYIGESGRCLVMQIVVNNKPAILVLLAARTSNLRTRDAAQLLHLLKQR